MRGRLREIRPRRHRRRSAGLSVALALVLLAAPRLAAGAPVRWIAAGGGPDPSSTQVSLEQDIELARDVLGSGGVVLFAGGPHAFGVQVLDDKRRGDPLLADLGDLFDPRDGRDAHYRLPALPMDGPATAARVRDALADALANGSDPLLFYFAGHGDKGDTPAGSSIRLWGDGGLSVADLADLLDRQGKRREVRLVITSCYSGGFADVAFAGASPERGAAPTKRCGFFASEWDQPASGCDPDPERGHQEGYGIYFWHALRGEDRDGEPLPLALLDLDHDGKISLLEAHTRARIASTSVDVPTTTSERWLRQLAPPSGPAQAVSLPEEDAVIRQLGKRLALADEAAVRQRHDQLSAALREAADTVARAEDEENDAYASLRIVLLQRWPALDDPWHPDFSATIGNHRAAIAALLGDAAAAKDDRAARDRLSRAQDRYDRLQLEDAPVRRLLRAYETRTLAGRLRAAGGAARDYYQALRACERGLP